MTANLSASEQSECTTPSSLGRKEVKKYYPMLEQCIKFFKKNVLKSLKYFLKGSPKKKQPNKRTKKRRKELRWK